MLRSCISVPSSSSSSLLRSVAMRRSMMTTLSSRRHLQLSSSNGNGIAGKVGGCSTYRIARHASTSTSTSTSSTSPSLHASREAYYKKRNQSLLLYSAAVLALMGGITYAAVPLYRIFCSQTGYGGVPMTGNSLGDAEGFGLGRFAKEKLVPFLGDDTRKERKIRVTFNADCSDALPWKFTPLQRDVKVRPGESALAFYTATNKSDKDIIGIATYNVTPNNIAPYFAKVECFCFEEQRLLAGEEVDLPILFFIDRDFVDDPTMRDVQDVVLSYTFFRAKRDDYGNLVPDTATD